MAAIEELLGEAKARGASDLLVMVGDSPAVRVAGRWERLELPRYTKELMETVVRALVRPEQWQELQQERELDFSCSFLKVGRVRCNVHYQRDHLAVVLRMVWPEIPDAKKLGIPAHVIQAGDLPHGLIVVSGPTGSGKSTTMAAIVEHINAQRPAHVITLEDPIEFIYSNKRSIIEQREIGSDTISWHTGLRTVLRQAPDVIVIGELRDTESIATALAAAETGHLVLTSVHSSNAVGALSRLIDTFPAAQMMQVRTQLSQSLRMVFAQRLVPSKQAEQRTLMYEILTMTPAVANVIRTGELEQIPNMISAGRQQGMMSFQQCGRELAEKGLLAEMPAR